MVPRPEDRPRSDAVTLTTRKDRGGPRRRDNANKTIIFPPCGTAPGDRPRSEAVTIPPHPCARYGKKIPRHSTVPGE